MIRSTVGRLDGAVTDIHISEVVFSETLTRSNHFIKGCSRIVYFCNFHHLLVPDKSVVRKNALRSLLDRVIHLIKTMDPILWPSSTLTMFCSRLPHESCNEVFDVNANWKLFFEVIEEITGHKDAASVALAEEGKLPEDFPDKVDLVNMICKASFQMEWTKEVIVENEEEYAIAKKCSALQWLAAALSWGLPKLGLETHLTGCFPTRNLDPKDNNNMCVVSIIRSLVRCFTAMYAKPDDLGGKKIGSDRRSQEQILATARMCHQKTLAHERTVKRQWLDQIMNCAHFYRSKSDIERAGLHLRITESEFEDFVEHSPQEQLLTPDGDPTVLRSVAPFLLQTGLCAPMTDRVCLAIDTGHSTTCFTVRPSQYKTKAAEDADRARATPSTTETPPCAAFPRHPVLFEFVTGPIGRDPTFVSPDQHIVRSRIACQLMRDIAENLVEQLVPALRTYMIEKIRAKNASTKMTEAFAAAEEEVLQLTSDIWVALRLCQVGHFGSVDGEIVRMLEVPSSSQGIHMVVSVPNGLERVHVDERADTWGKEIGETHRCVKINFLNQPKIKYQSYAF